MPPIPIDSDAQRAARLACNATRPRRFATDPARRRYYAAHRSGRFARRFAHQA
jgi:hypothetical protein